MATSAGPASVSATRTAAPRSSSISNAASRSALVANCMITRALDPATQGTTTPALNASARHSVHHERRRSCLIKIPWDWESPGDIEMYRAEYYRRTKFEPGDLPPGPAGVARLTVLRELAASE